MVADPSQKDFTGNSLWENCILLDFYFRGLNVPRNQQKWNPTIIYDFTVVCITSVMRTILLYIRMEKSSLSRRKQINHQYNSSRTNSRVHV
jgi:hypothetical protein